MLFHRTTAFVIPTAFISLMQVHAYRYIGCFGPPTDLGHHFRHIFQSVGLCRDRCGASHQPVMAVTNQTDCLCGAVLPPWNRMVEESYCNTPCAGYARDICGGRGFFSIYLDEDDNSEDPPNDTSTRLVDATVATCMASSQPSAWKSQLPGISDL
ncbi:hypothetical protein F4779DRAFT_569452 [Xylariaceae sp. FL0662B]|nr:hypothetical protein F4779DRAFT_569452 [Xylariaceae sp. FL0662B]